MIDGAGEALVFEHSYGGLDIWVVKAGVANTVREGGYRLKRG
jgi:hypothetical protein